MRSKDLDALHRQTMGQKHSCYGSLNGPKLLSRVEGQLVLNNSWRLQHVGRTVKKPQLPLQNKRCACVTFDRKDRSILHDRHT